MSGARARNMVRGAGVETMEEPHVTEELGIASTVHALDATAVALRPTGPLEAPLVRGTSGRTRYEVHGHLGAGGMGTVDAVWDADLMRYLAIKRLRPELRDDARMIRQFLWEARVTAHLDHPNILPIHDLAIGERGTLFFSMKRVQGQSLEAALAAVPRAGAEARATREPFGLPRRLRVFVQICHAVAFAHARGVLHRDLKPANVMLGEHGEVLVMDWGLAMPLPDARGRALEALRVVEDEPHSRSGTPLYMSPEQVKDAPLDERSDVYALGVMLYELASRTRPYDASSLPALLAQIAVGDARRLTDVMPDAPASLVAVVERAMALDPASRYATVAEMRDDVERVLDGQTPGAERVGMLRRAARAYMSRNRGLSRLRVVDVEMLMTASSMIGAAGAGLVVTEDVWPWLVGAASVLLWAPPSLRWWREQRARDDDD